MNARLRPVVETPGGYVGPAGSGLGSRSAPGGLQGPLAYGGGGSGRRR
jgi:hypothetical protein